MEVRDDLAVRPHNRIQIKGRRRALLYNNLWYFAGGAFMTIGNNIAQLSLGRFLVGIGAGSSSVVVQLYINEVSPTSLRGTMGTCNQLSIVLGIAVSQLIGVPLSTPSLWRLLFASSWGMCPEYSALVLFLTTYVLS